MLMAETKTVATQNIKFEVEVKSVSKSVSGTLVQSGFWCNEENRLFKTNWFVRTPKSSVGILMEQIKPVVSEKIEFEHRVKPKVIALFGIFGPSGFCCKEEIRQLFNQKACQKLRTSDWGPLRRNQASTNGETWFRKSRWFKTKPSVLFRTSRF